ncbi:MAG: hypothetical protein MZV65_20540 [Chromatiales bacterium]|nr:hypothetical protein [Chromatiales bacterium]
MARAQPHTHSRQVLHPARQPAGRSSARSALFIADGRASASWLNGVAAGPWMLLRRRRDAGRACSSAGSAR